MARNCTVLFLKSDIDSDRETERRSIQDVKPTEQQKQVKKIKIEVKAYRSQRKGEHHHLVNETEKNQSKSK